MPPDHDAVAEAVRKAVPDVQAVLLYGSHARGEPWPDSDLDIAVLAVRTVVPKTLFDLSGELEGLCGRKVDLVDARRAPPTLRAALMADLRPLGAFDARALAEWEAQSLTAYGLLNAERRELLQDFWDAPAHAARKAA